MSILVYKHVAKQQLIIFECQFLKPDYIAIFVSDFDNKVLTSS